MRTIYGKWSLASGALVFLASCAFDTSSETMEEEIGGTQQAICKTYPDCRPDPEDEPDDPPPPPPPAVSKPDIALQFTPCAPDALRTQLQDAIRTGIPNAVDVRAACASGSERVGIWFRAASSGASDDAAARGRGLNALNLLQGSETFGGLVNSRFINATVNTAWAAAPRVLDGNGRPDPGGPVHLSSLSLRYTPPNQVASIVNGYDERPWPDISFTLTTTDTLSVANGRIQCQSVPKLDTHESWLNYLTGFLGILFPPLGIYLIVTDAFGSSGADTGGSNAGSVACPAVKVFPAEIVLPLGLKVAVTYGRAQSSSSGLVVGGTYEIKARTPSAGISGSRSLTAAPGESASYGAYAARATDMRAPFSYQWTSSGTVSSPTSSGTGVTFSLAGHNHVGNVKNDSLQLRIVDADGLVANASAAIKTTIRLPIEDTPVCRNKPYLPQCQEP